MVESYEEIKPIVRPEGINSGQMVFDSEVCISCGQCIENCVFACLIMDEEEHPKMKKVNACFSCFNCMVACPVDAISIGTAYHVDGGFFDLDFPDTKIPLPPQDADGNPEELTVVEQTVLNRRSVRNYKKEPVPEPLIRRILEAGRFAPSAGNNQPWKFTVVTNPDFIEKLEEACWAVWENVHKMYTSDEKVVELFEMLGGPSHVGTFDPRVLGGVGCVSRKETSVFHKAPAVIFVGSNERMYGPEMQVGICGQNMNLVANSLGLGACWIGFSVAINFIPELKNQLGFEDTWKITTAFSLGYPAFKQEGIVPRQYRPVTWFRPGKEGADIEK